MKEEEKYVQSEQALSVDMDSDIVIMSLTSGDYYGVSGIGPFIWQLLGQPQSLSQVVEAVCDDYEVEADTASADVAKFLDILVERGVVEKV